MSLRFGEQYEGGFYHVFNRGTDKRIIFKSQKDYKRFLEALEILNTTKVVNSVRNAKKGDLETKLKDSGKLIEIYAYCLLPNHFHLVLRQVSENGVSKFMQKISMSYSKYFNTKYDRSGRLFQGTYKYIEISGESHLMRMISYVNRNNEVHRLTDRHLKSVRGHREFEKEQGICEVKEVIKIFGSVERYFEISESVIRSTLKSRNGREADLLE